LKILEKADLVQSSKDGLWVNYTLSPGKLNPYAASLLGNLWHWLDEDPEIDDMVKKVPFLNRLDVCPKG
jgi:ArsR family transcriptional regulator, arsenate/arsenite/antimonite-responsive transcriptional repressor